MKFTTKTAFAILLLAAFSVAQQSQHQRTIVNSNNNNSDSRNVTASGGAGGTGGTADAAGGTGTGGQASAAGGNSQSGASSNAQTENTNIPRQTFSAIAPQPFHTAPCVKGWGGAAQTGWAGLSLGAGKVDQGCDIRETAEEFRNAGSLVAFCKMLVTEPSAKKAGVSFQDCMTIVPPQNIAEESPSRPEPVMAPPQIIVPPAQVTVNMPTPAVATPVLIPPPPVPVKHRSTKPKVDKNCPAVEK